MSEFWPGLIVGLVTGAAAGCMGMALAFAGRLPEAACPSCDGSGLLGGDGPWCSRCQGSGIVTPG